MLQLPKASIVVRKEDLSFAFVVNVMKNVFLFNGGILHLVNRNIKCTKLVWVEIPCSLALTDVA